MRITFLVCVIAAALSLPPMSVVSHSASGDIVIRASDVTVVAGAWTKLNQPNAADGQMLATADVGWSSTEFPLAAPQHYFEATFEASAATTYKVWLRMRGAADSKWNESVWVQFDEAVDSAGQPLWRVGSSSALLVNLENCSGCGVSGWGWQDNAYWLNQSGHVRFPTTGTHSLRVQVREDGVGIDQIILSPVTWLSSSPGALKNDTTIVPRPSATPTVTLVRHPYLQHVGATRATVVWATRENGIATLRYALNGSVATVPAKSRLVPLSVTGMPYDYYQHEAPLTNLKPATTYTYTPALDGVAVAAGAPLTTAPNVGAGTIRFIAFGDSGVGSAEQKQLATRMTADRFDFALHTGDVAYETAAPAGPGGYPQLHSWFFDIYSSWLRTRPVFPSIGNHDEEANHAAPYRDVFVLPANGASTTFPDHSVRYYSFDYGPAHVVVLDTELAFQDLTRRQAQVQWLEQDLAATRQPWKIAVFHRSPYSAGGEHQSDFDVRAVFGPMFDRHHVDLVLSGHEHDYERTIPIRETADGGPTVYVVTGGGGAKLYPAATAWWTAASRSAFHYMRGVIESCKLTLEAVGLTGTVFDSTVIDKCTSAIPPNPASSAYGGTPAAVPGIIQAEYFDEGTKNIAYFDTTVGNAGGSVRATDVDIQSSTDAGGGYNVGWIKPGEWLKYSVRVAETRSYTLSARVASNGPGGTFHVEVDGVNVSGPLTIPDTGGHQNWVTIAKAGIGLTAGARSVRLVFDASSATGAFGNVNYLRLE
jgi:hypothetical protein